MILLGVLTKSNNYSFVNIDDCWNKNNKSNLLAVDLFSGCGGISKGFDFAGISVIAGLDSFKEAGETYKANFNHDFIFGDITKIEIKKKLYKIVNDKLKGKKLNIISGGFPCQGFSMSGKRYINDPRNKLYLDAVEVIGTLKPDFIFLENVKGLISMGKGKVKEEILDNFRKIGYNIEVKILNAADFETPQKRERVVFLGNKIGKTILYPKLLNNQFKTIKDAIFDLVDRKEDEDFSHIFTKHTTEMKARLANLSEGKSLYKNYSDSWKKCFWNEASSTIKENHGGVNVHPKLPRVLTVRECARIQSFPDDFLFKGSKTKQLIQVGNAVPPNLAKAVGIAIIKNYE